MSAVVRGLMESLSYIIQVDQSTNVDNKIIMLVFMLIFFWGMCTDMLCALLFSTNIMAAQLFKSLNDHLRRMELIICGWYTDGVAAQDLTAFWFH